MSSSRPRLSQPSGDGSQTVEFFFQRAHFSILGDVSKKHVIKVGEQPTLSHVPPTFLVFFIVTGFSMNVAFVDFFLVCLCVWGGTFENFARTRAHKDIHTHAARNA